MHLSPAGHIFHPALRQCQSAVTVIGLPRPTQEATAMQITCKIAFIQKGAKKLLVQYGSQLVCVRYRYDEQEYKRLKTIELAIEEPLVALPHLSNDRPVGVHVTFQEVGLKRQVKQAGGKWNPERRVWKIHYYQVLALGLEARIERQKHLIL